MIEKPPKIGFVSLGNPNLDDAKKDAARVLETLRKEKLEILTVDKMTWQMPNEIYDIAENLIRERLDLVLILATTAATSICVAELVNKLSTPVLIWALPTRYAVPSSASAVGYLREQGRAIEFMAKTVDDESAYRRVSDLATAAYAKGRLRESKIGLLGQTSPFLLSSRFNEDILVKRFGIKIDRITKEVMDASLKMIEDKDAETYAMNLSRRFKVKVKYNVLINASKFHLALKEIMKNNQLDAVAVECWTNFVPNYNVNPCLGHVENVIFGCEGDLPMVISSLSLYYLSGITPFLSDPYGMNYNDNILTVCHCSAPLELASNPENTAIMGRRPIGTPTIQEITAFCNIPLRKERVTLFRIQGSSLNRAHMALGEVIESREMEGNICVDIKLSGILEHFVQQMNGQHYCMVYGDIRHRVAELCKGYEIELVET